MSDTDVSATLALVLADLESRIDRYDAQVAANKAAASDLEAQYPGMPLGLVQQDPATLLVGVQTVIISARDLLAKEPGDQASKRLDTLVVRLGESRVGCSQ